MCILVMDHAEVLSTCNMLFVGAPSRRWMLKGGVQRGIVITQEGDPKQPMGGATGSDVHCDYGGSTAQRLHVPT